MWFFRKKELESKEFETLYSRIVDVEQRVRRLELNEEDLRDKVLRKIQIQAQHKYDNITSTPPASNIPVGGKVRR